VQNIFIPVYEFHPLHFISKTAIKRTLNFSNCRIQCDETRVSFQWTLRDSSRSFMMESNHTKFGIAAVPALKTWQIFQNINFRQMSKEISINSIFHLFIQV